MNLFRALAARSTSVCRPHLRPAAYWRGSIIIVTLVFIGLLGSATPASAHGGDPTKEGYLMVQQALGHLAHDSSHQGIALAMENINEALAAEDQDGVAVAEVAQAEQALEQGRVGQGRALLQDSIKEALSELGPATGEETGTTVVMPALPGRNGLTGRDFGFLAISLGFIVVGLFLAVRFRPQDTIEELRQRLTPPAGEAGNPSASTRGDG